MTLSTPLYDHREAYYGSRAIMMSPTEFAQWLGAVIPTGLKFDTLVGTGLSGTIAIVKLATVWPVHTAFIRKISESNHSSRIIEGSIGKNWLFIDDLICTGSTASRCAEVVKDIAPDARCVGGLLYGEKVHSTAIYLLPSQMNFYGAVI